jgi:hypothetical protein
LSFDCGASSPPPLSCSGATLIIPPTPKQHGALIIEKDVIAPVVIIMN